MTENNIPQFGRETVGLKRMPEWDSQTVEMYIWEVNPGRALVGFDKCPDHHLAFVLDSETMKFRYTCEHMVKGVEIMNGWVR